MSRMQSLGRLSFMSSGSLSTKTRRKNVLGNKQRDSLSLMAGETGGMTPNLRDGTMQSFLLGGRNSMVRVEGAARDLSVCAGWAQQRNEHGGLWTPTPLPSGFLTQPQTWRQEGPLLATPPAMLACLVHLQVSGAAADRIHDRMTMPEGLPARQQTCLIWLLACKCMSGVAAAHITLLVKNKLKEAGVGHFFKGYKWGRVPSRPK
eukprot:1155618-Pelagomonas_calceolata.AAC.1